MDPDTFCDHFDIDENEEVNMRDFMSSKPKKTLTLADIIQEKITDTCTEVLTQYSDVDTLNLQDIDPR